jgi:arylsulfatase A-like enzyme
MRRIRASLAILAMLTLASSLAASTIVPPMTAPASPSRPNVVIILTDDQRADDLSHMDAVRDLLVRHGVSFDRAFASNPLCCPSRTSILRGQYSHTTGIYSNIDSLNGGWEGVRERGLERSMLGPWLDAAGYRTALVGKYLNHYDDPTYVPPGWDFWRARDFGYYNYTVSEDGVPRTYGSAPTDYSTDVFTRYAEEFIRTTDPATPLFLYLAYNAPHEPSIPAPKYASDPRCDDAVTTGRPTFNERDVRDKPSDIASLPRMTAAEQQYVGVDFPIARCRTLLSVDDGVRRVMHALSATARLQNTIIFFMSDNGLLLGEHRVQGKGEPYEEAIRLPLVVRYDALTATSPRTVHRLVGNVDLAPTIVDLLDLESAPGIPLEPGCPDIPYGPCSGDFDGMSLMPLLDRTATRWRTGFLIENNHLCGIRTSSDIMFDRNQDGEEELYDLESDPYEETNLLFGTPSPTTMALRDRLLSRVKQMCQPTPPGYAFGSTGEDPVDMHTLWRTDGSPPVATHG